VSSTFHPHCCELTCYASVGGIGSGAVTNMNDGGWRAIFWMQAAFHAATAVGLLLFYHPIKGSDYGKLSLREVVWACDPIGSFFLISSATLLLLALDWTGGAYSWSDAHVAAPLAIGLVFLVVFCVYGENLNAWR
jgi:Fungal trichothecene efflux pump (TRI12)